MASRLLCVFFSAPTRLLQLLLLLLPTLSLPGGASIVPFSLLDSNSQVRRAVVSRDPLPFRVQTGS